MQPQGFCCGVLIGDFIKSLGPAAIQAVGFQGVAHVHRHTFHAHGSAVVQVAPFPADFAPAGMVVFRHPLGGQLAHFLDGPGYLVFGGGAGCQAGGKAPFARHPVHGIQFFAADDDAPQLLLVAVPSVQYEKH